MSNLSSFMHCVDSKIPEARGAHWYTSVTYGIFMTLICAYHVIKMLVSDLICSSVFTHNLLSAPSMIHSPLSLNKFTTHDFTIHRHFLQSFLLFFTRSSHLGLFTGLTEAYSECDWCWKDFPPSPEGLFRPGAAVVIGLGDAWSVSTSGAELGSCSGEPPTSVLLCCFTAAHSRCQAMGKILQTFPGIKWFDLNSSLSASTTNQKNL